MQWPARPAAKLALVESYDGHAGLRRALSEIAEHKREWAGIPMPLEKERLVVEPSYPNAEGLMEMGADNHGEALPNRDGMKVRNMWYDSRKRCDIAITEQDGKISWGWIPAVHHLKLDLATLGCSEAWGIEQESNALQTLANLLRHRAFKQYLLTGSFLETSRRSGITYMFRKLKPTVAITPHRGDELRILCTLCMHPIAYYQGSWAGAMCPTDDVIAHLQLMRADEAMY